MKLFRGLRFQFILLTFLCVTFTVIITSYTVIKRERRLLEQTVEQQALMLAKSSAILFTNSFIYKEMGMLNSSGMADYLEFYVTDVMAMDSRIESFSVFDKNGLIVTHNDLRRYGAKIEGESYDEMFQTIQPVLKGFEQDGLELLEIVMPLSIEKKIWGGCRIVFSLQEIRLAKQDLQKKVLLSAIFSLLLSLILIGFAADYFIKPLKKLSEVMGRITVGKDTALPIPDAPDRKDEIGQLQQSFSWMTRRLKDEERARIQTFEKLIHTEKMATVGQLTASIAHEINNPLGGVTLCFENLMSGQLDDESRKQHIEVINYSLEKMQNTMRDLLDYSRQAELSMEMTPISTVVSRSVALVEVMLSRSRVKLDVDVSDNLPQIMLDSMKMQQVLVNLLVNSAQAMVDGGTISIYGDIKNDYLQLVISDSGPGIPPDIQEKIFDPFFTTKEIGKGTGLGLALSRSIVEQHGGKLLLKESDCSGTCFSILLPLSGGVHA